MIEEDPAKRDIVSEMVEDLLKLHYKQQEMLSKNKRQKNKSEIFKDYHIVADQDGAEKDYWFSARSEDHALDMFKSFAEYKSIDAQIISVTKE